MGRVGGRQSLLDQSADRTALHAAAALFDDYVPLLVKLTHHRMKEAFRLKKRPQFEFVRGQGIVIVGLVAGGIGVEADATIIFDKLRKLFVSYVLIGGF